jgi:hypothetical protein
MNIEINFEPVPPETLKREALKPFETIETRQTSVTL